MTDAPTSVRAGARFRPAGPRALLGVLLVVSLAAGCSTVETSSASSPAPALPTGASSLTTVAHSTTSTAHPSTSAAEPALAKPKIPANGAYFGAWRGPGPGRSTDPRVSIATVESAIGRTYAIDHQFYDWGAPIPDSYDRWTAQRGRIPMVSLCACRFKDGSNVAWARIASGKEDTYLNSAARGLVAFAKPVFLVFDSEPEAQVGVRGTVADYLAAWNHVVTLFRARGATNVAFVWAMTAYAFRPESGELALAESLYPGDKLVDWIASDPYNFDQNGAWHSLSFELGPWYSWATTHHATKPLALTEWGTKEDPNQPNRKAAWFRDATSNLESNYQAIRAVVYFDERKHERGIVNDWRVDTSPASLAAFAEVAHAAWFRPRS
jgi:hypothetical protein